MKKSKMNLSHNASLTGDMGNLIPFCVIDCLPNDSHRLKLQSFVRAQPMLAPLMHIVNLYAQYWFVPYRLLWNDWEEFITGGSTGNADKNLTFPTIKVTPTASSLADYFGLPVNGKELEVSAMPFRAMVEIWNTRYRDEDLQDELPISYEGGLDTITRKDLLRCSWAKDRFTTARPFTQRGSQISVPVIPASVTGTAYPVYSPNVAFGNFTAEKPTNTELGTMTITSYAVVNSRVADNLASFNPYGEAVITFSILDEVRSVDTTTGYFTVNIPVSNESYDGKSTPSCPNVTVYLPVTITWGNPTSYSDAPITQVTGARLSDGFWGQPGCQTALYFVETLNRVFIAPTLINISLPKTSIGTAGAINIRDLRAASAIQRYQERSLEYGNRYEEFIQREFGIKPRDSRIQRPEYLGGGKSVLQISEVLQTAEGTDSGVGTMRGHGVAAFSSRGVRFRCPEHGVIIGLLSIRPHGVYTQGVEKFWRKFSKLDYFVPELANIGMQEVWQSELYANGENFNTVFGYEPRYNEYRKMPNRIAGEFRELLNYWNLARKFDAPPVLNSSFITMNPSKRVFAEQTQNSFLIMLYNKIQSFRPVPKRAKNILR